MNGLALKDRRPAYVTSVSQTDVNEDWREHRTTGGVVIDVQSNEIVTAPDGRRVWLAELDQIAEIPVVQGLHHYYLPRAA